MKTEILTLLAQYLSALIGRALPMEPRTYDPSAWDGRGIDAKTPQVRQAITAWRILDRTYQDATTRVHALVLWWVYVRHGEEARKRDAALLAEMALHLAPPRRTPKRNAAGQLEGEVLAKWIKRGTDLHERAVKFWERIKDGE